MHRYQGVRAVPIALQYRAVGLLVIAVTTKSTRIDARGTTRFGWSVGV